MKHAGVLLALFVAAAGGPALSERANPRVEGQAPRTYHPSADEARAIDAKLSDLAAHVDVLTAKKTDPALVADVAIYWRAAELIRRFPEEFATQAFVADT